MTDGHGRRRRTTLVVVMACAVAVAAIAMVRRRDGAKSFHNVATPPGLQISAEAETVSFSADIGVVGFASLFSVRVVAPVTLINVRPWDAGTVEVLAARAVVSGRGTSPGGYLMSPGSPLGGCRRSWPVEGFGRSYPAAGMTLKAGDPLDLVYYVRSTRPGRHTIRGYRIEYRTADGRTHVATGDLPVMVMNLQTPGEKPGADDPSPCHPDVESGWTEAVPGFPR